MPALDLFTLQRELSGIDLVLPTSTPSAYQPGDVRTFWIANLESAEMWRITATLQVAREHVQMWLQEGLEIDREALQRSAERFEKEIYPTTCAFFGSEWSPGIDGDPHLLILNAAVEGALGYFASANEYPRGVHPYSNEAEMFVMNVGPDGLTPGTTSYDAVLAHELQHMIHWYQDSNEDAWVNEGAADLAEHINGFSWPQAAVASFAQDPDLQLNTWSDHRLHAHYGASFLILRYFLDRYGKEALRALISEQRNGIDAFEAVLAIQGEGMTFDDLFADWLVANILDAPEYADGRYGYRQIDVSARSQEQISDYPYRHIETVHQYGADYFELSPSITHTLRVHFAGDTMVRLVPNAPFSGRYQWWSNQGDVSHSYLEHAFDLTQVSSATLSYELWYDIEAGWDYAYVRASKDGGGTWQLLRGRYSSDLNPRGNALGPGYTGRSGLSLDAPQHEPPQWVHEEIDLGEFVGHEVLVRFDYVTDDALHHAGLCLDDIALEAVGFFDDVEQGVGAWRAVGFVRHDNTLPQRYLVQLVTVGETVQVQRLPVDGAGYGKWNLDPPASDTKRLLLIVAATTPITRESAAYRLNIEARE